MVDKLLVDNFKLKNCEIMEQKSTVNVEDDNDKDKVMTTGAAAAARANENEELNKWMGKIDSDLKGFLEMHDTESRDLTWILKRGNFKSMKSIAGRYKNSDQFVDEATKAGLKVPFAMNLNG